MFIFRHTLKLYLRHWRRFVLLVLLAAVLCAAAGLLGSALLSRDRVVDGIRLMVVDQDNSVESQLFYNLLTSSDLYDSLVTFEKTDEDTARRALERGDASAMVILPEHFTQSILEGDNLPPTILYSPATPLKTQLVHLYAEAFIDMLKTSQVGVYTALDYALDHGSNEQYEAVFWESNMGYLRVVGARARTFDIQQGASAGRVSLFVWYLTHLLVFLLCLSPVLLLDILQPMLSASVLRRLRRHGVGMPTVWLGSWLATLLLYCLAGVLGAGCLLLLGRWAPQLPAPQPHHLLLLLAVLSALSSFVLVIALLFHRTAGGGLFLSVLAAGSLFFAGGIIPHDYLAPWVQNTGFATLQYWAARLLQSGVSGDKDLTALGAVLGIALVLSLLGALLLRQRERGNAVP